MWHLLQAVVVLLIKIVAVVSRSSRSSSDDEIVDTEKGSLLLRTNVVEWIRDHGGIFHEEQEFRQDDNGIYGIYATDDIVQGQILTQVPHECILTAYSEDDDHNDDDWSCESISLLSDELLKGKDNSFYGPYIQYVLEQPTIHLPMTFSTQAKQLFEEVVGYDMIPPQDWDYDDYTMGCSGLDANDDLQRLAALLFVTRGDDDHLCPLYDMYNHRNGKEWHNTVTEHKDFHSQSVLASRDIKAGEQIYVSYNQCEFCGGRHDNYGTPEIFRDYGFVEPFPQRWIFSSQNLTIDIAAAGDNNNDDDDDDIDTNHEQLHVYWDNESDRPSRAQIIFLQEQLYRLQHVIQPKLTLLSTTTVTTDDPTALQPHELAMIQSYHDAIMTVLSLAVKDASNSESDDDDGEGDDEEMCSTNEEGVCMLDSNAYYDLSDMGAEDGTFQTCDNDETLLFHDYEWIEVFESSYQTITFAEKKETDDMCLDLDDVGQICSSYRPHYHEFVTHLPARYRDELRRVVFVGGGDSMVLHELLKYPEMEKVVGLELDQAVVRHSFRHFNTQPHFDDPRVEWWFGDASKSLLLLPKEYFGSFDLVVVDLSETVMAFTVTEGLNIREALALLLKPDGIFVKNGLYFDQLSEIFDYTMQVDISDVPVICDQAIAIGSNRVDFLHPDTPTLMKDRGHIEMLLMEPVTDVKNRFSYLHDYRKNDARAQGKCFDSWSAHHQYIGQDDSSSEEEQNSGIIMIVDAESTTVSLEWKTLESVLVAALEKEGIVSLTSDAHEAQNGGIVGFILFKEGIVVVRTWPDERYCAFDIQLWGAFDKMNLLRDALTQAVQSKTVSSYRLVISGMIGTKTHDIQTIGPRIIQNRNCDNNEKPPVGAEKQTDVSPVDESTVGVILEESLKLLLDETDNTIVAAVLCGDKNQECRSLDVLAKHPMVQKVVAIHSCPSIESAPYVKHGMAQMFACEMEATAQIRTAVEEMSKPLSVFVLDESSDLFMAQVLDRVWMIPRNQNQLLNASCLFLATMLDPSQVEWRRNFLGKRRRFLGYRYLNRAQVVLESAHNSSSSSMEFGLVLTGNADFLSRLLHLVGEIEKRTGLQGHVKRIQGGPPKYQDYYQEKRFTSSHYDSTLGRHQYEEQRPLGDQVLLQIQIAKRAKKDVMMAMEKLLVHDALHRANFAVSQFKVYEELGHGVIFVALAPEGTVVVVWNGDVKVDVNLFAFQSEDTIALLLNQFLKTLKESKMKPEILVRDEMPRGVGRVINFRDELVESLPPLSVEKPDSDSSSSLQVEQPKVQLTIETIDDETSGNNAGRVLTFHEATG